MPFGITVKSTRTVLAVFNKILCREFHIICRIWILQQLYKAACLISLCAPTFRFQRLKLSIFGKSTKPKNKPTSKSTFNLKSDLVTYGGVTTIFCFCKLPSGTPIRGQSLFYLRWSDLDSKPIDWFCSCHFQFWNAYSQNLFPANTIKEIANT